MKRTRAFVVAALVAFGPPFAAMATAEDKPREILVASDAIRNPGVPYSVTATLTEYKQGVLPRNLVLKMYLKEDKQGRVRSLVRFESPQRDAGKLILKDGIGVWFYDPKARKPVSITQQQRLLGQAAAGDAISGRLAQDYRIDSASEEDVQDGDLQVRRCYKLNLSSSNQEQTYRKFTLWLDARMGGPVKARYYSDSGAVLKTAYFRRYEHVLGRSRPTEVVIIDGLDSKWVTTLRFGDFTRRDIPDMWFRSDYLPRFR